MSDFPDEFLANLQELHADMRQTIRGLSVEALDWAPGLNMNSLAVLLVHVLGAGRYWIGDVVAGEASGRDREDEFKVAGLTEENLLEKVTEADRYARRVLEKMDIQSLDEVRISPRNGRQVTVGWALCHALKHTALHLGHMQMTRQLWDQRHP